MKSKKIIVIISFIFIITLMLIGNPVNAEEWPKYYVDENNNFYTCDPTTDKYNTGVYLWCKIHGTEETVNYMVSGNNYVLTSGVYEKYAAYGIRKSIPSSEVKGWTTTRPVVDGEKAPRRYLLEGKNIYYTDMETTPSTVNNYIWCEIYGQGISARYSFRLSDRTFVLDNKDYLKFGIRETITYDETKGWSTERPVIDDDDDDDDDKKRESIGALDIETVFEDADAFINTSTKEYEIDKATVKNLSGQIYRTLMIIGVVVAFVIGGILAIEFITGGIEEKAQIKQKIIIYVIGLVLLFGAFTIWSVVTNALQDVAETGESGGGKGDGEEEDEPLPKGDYEFIGNTENQEYTISKDDSLTFRIDADYSLFENGGKVYVDDKEITQYTSKSGSTIIVLNKNFLDSLSEGKHILKVVFKDGKFATTRFTVVKQKSKKDPDPGDGDERPGPRPRGEDEKPTPSENPATSDIPTKIKLKRFNMDTRIKKKLVQKKDSNGVEYITSYLGESEPEGLPMIVYLPGLGECQGYTRLNNLCVSQFIAYGYAYNLCDEGEFVYLAIVTHYNGEGYTNEKIDKIMECIDHVADEHKVDKNRISITGVSDGAHAIWRIVDRYPYYFSAAAPVSGFCYDDKYLEGCVGIPFRAYVGENDAYSAGRYDYKNSMIRDAKKLRELGGNIELFEVEGATHQSEGDNAITAKVFTTNGIYNWLIGQKRK